MSIETICPGCGRKLRVAGEHAGKQARCPLCNAIYTVSSGESEQPAAPVEGESDQQWRMRAPEGQTYGPVTKAELDQWVAEGRVTADCQLHGDGTGQWRPADEVYQVLRPQVHQPTPRPAPNASPAPAATRRYQHTESHRGVLILALGILSWIACPIFGVAAWMLGNRDLREMRSGRMDPSGMGLTQAGQILGMIHAILIMGALIIGAFVLLASAVMSQL